jgi:glyoxylase-like metal-dependent hydrolase (beta-lactamase superfamily II)
MVGLSQDLGGKGLDAVWITHQHSDHVGGAEDVLTGCNPEVVALTTTGDGTFTME